MAVDINILRLMKERQEFRRVFGRIPDAALNKETRVVLDDYKKYFTQFPDHDHIDMDVFTTLFRTWHSTLKDDIRMVYEGILQQAKDDIPEDARAQITRNVLELRLATELANDLTKYDAGDLPNIFASMRDRMDEFKADAGIADKTYIQDDIHDLLQDDDSDAGLKWRLGCLNNSMRPLRPGDFGIIAGRPDRGKTTFIASELTCFAEQVTGDRNLLWLNNEGLGKRIIPRLYQAALGATRTQLLTLMHAGLLKDAYIKKMRRLDKIRVVDIHGMDNFSVEQIIEANNAEVVVYDMIDNIRGFASESRTDQALEKMYQWGRDTAVRFGHVGLATSQISVEGDNMQFPAMSMLKDSKTGKQGACDFQIMIGSLNDPGFSNVRYIGVPKNKLRRDGAPGDPREAVKFDAMRARFEDTPIAGDSGVSSD